MSDLDPEVSALLAEARHPLAADIQAFRLLILGIAPEIEEGVKWRSASYRTTEWFATVQLRSVDRLQVVLHLGAKIRDIAPGAEAVPDPTGLLDWRGRDRALLTLPKGARLADHAPAVEAVIRSWLGWV